MSFKPEMEVCGESGKWYQNGQTFATREEAEKSAYNRFYNWTSATGHRAVEVDSKEFPVNYRWVEGVGDVSIEHSEVEDPSPLDNTGHIVLLTPPEGLTEEE